MKILVCGGRDFTKKGLLARVLTQLVTEKNTAIIQGGAKGADALAKAWAIENGFPMIEVPPNWDMFNKSAGSIRNGWMLEFCQPDLVVAFPGGRGTADMVSRVKHTTIRLLEIKDE